MRKVVLVVVMARLHGSQLLLKADYLLLMILAILLQEQH